MTLNEFAAEINGPIKVVRNKDGLWASCPTAGLVVIE